MSALNTADLTAVLLTNQERRVVAACIAVVVAGATDSEVRDLTALWLRIHPEDQDVV